MYGPIGIGHPQIGGVNRRIKKKWRKSAIFLSLIFNGLPSNCPCARADPENPPLGTAGTPKRPKMAVFTRRRVRRGKGSPLWDRPEGVRDPLPPPQGRGERGPVFQPLNWGEEVDWHRGLHPARHSTHPRDEAGRAKGAPTLARSLTRSRSDARIGKGYDHWDYKDEKREAMERWADYVQRRS
jgi:hypothetical protein